MYEILLSCWTYLWPPSVAMCKAVQSVTLCFADITASLSNFISSEMTSADPFLAAMRAQVFPSLVAADTKEGLAPSNISITGAYGKIKQKWYIFGTYWTR